jgi:hypothetical protein
LVQIAPTPQAFRAAIDAYAFEDTQPPAVSGCPLLLVGEAHGAGSRMPAVLERVAAGLGATAFAFEWSHDELGPLLDHVVARGRFDVEALWSLPPAAEAFNGDGRLTAGHVALLERLWRDGRLSQLIACDRLDPDPPAPWHDRDREMAGRIVELWDPSLRLVAVLGAAHAVRAPGTVAALLDVDGAMFDYGAGVSMPAATTTFAVPPGPPPVVPGR